MHHMRRIAILGCILLASIHTRAGQLVAPSDNTEQPFMGIYRWGLGVQSNRDSIEFATSWLNRNTPLWSQDFTAQSTWADIEGPDWFLNGAKAWLDGGENRVSILSIAMLPGSSVQASDELAAGASGAYNDHFQTLAQRLVNLGIAQHVILRPGWEFNGHWYRWMVKNKSDAQSFAHYFEQIVRTMRAVPGAEALKFAWNGIVRVDQTVGAYELADAYPGDEVVDYIAVDVYDQSWASNAYGRDGSGDPYPANASDEEIREIREYAWLDITQGKGGLAEWLAFAKDRNKPLAIGEWGLNNRGANGGLDNTYYVEQMFKFIHNRDNNVAWHVYFDIQASDGHHQLTPWNGDTEFPIAADLFQQLFSPGGGGIELNIASIGDVTNYSSQQDSNEARNLIDDVRRSRWAAEASGYPQQVEIDLGAEYTLSQARLQTYENRPYEYLIEFATDPGNYSLAVDRSNNTDGGVLIDTFNPQKARFVKLSVLGSSEADVNWVSMNELELTGLPLSASPSEETTLFYDGFDDGGDSHWRNFPADQWQIVDDAGDFAFKFTTNDSHLSGTAFIGDRNWTNYSVSVDITQAEPQAWSDSRILARFQDNNNHYGARVKNQATSDQRQLSIYKRVAGQDTTLGTAMVNWTENSRHTLTFSLDNNTLNLNLDGEPIIQTSDSTFSRGSIGLRVVRQTVLFDNLKVAGE